VKFEIVPRIFKGLGSKSCTLPLGYLVNSEEVFYEFGRM